MLASIHRKIFGLGATASAGVWLAVAMAAMPAPVAAQGTASYQAALQRMLARPSDAEAAFQFAMVAAQQGDLNGAISALERILFIFPDLDNIRLELGVLHLRNGNAALGQQLIQQAIQSPDIPDEVRARSQEFLNAASAAQAPVAFAGTVALGLRHDSNANAAPSDTFSIGSFTLSEDSTGRADNSFSLGTTLRTRVDLGAQAGHQLAVDLSYFGNRYRNETQLDLDRLGLAAGVDLNLGMGGPSPSRLSFRLDAARYTRDGDHFLTETGASLRYAFRPSPTIQTALSAYYLDQDYRPTSAEPNNNLRDGRIAGVSAQVDMALSDTRSVFFALNGYHKSAEVDYEAFRDVTLAVGYNAAFEGPAAWKAPGPWWGGLSASVGRRTYDGPDLVIDPNDARQDTLFRVAATLRVPVSQRGRMTTELSFTRRNSNYPTSEYDNMAVSVGYEFNF